MTRHLLLNVLAPLLSLPVCAQQVPVAASQEGAPAATAAPAQQPPVSILHDGTPVKLRLVNKLDSHTAKNGDEIPFDVVNDVVVGGITVLRRGASATGVITQASAAKTLGREGRLSFVVKDIPLRDGSKVPVRAFNKTSGENRTGEMVEWMINVPIAAAPFFLLMHGTNTTFPRGTEINAFVNGDLQLKLAGFAAAASNDTASNSSTVGLHISSTPDGAQIQIDGAAVGITPLNLPVAAGKHEISIKKSGYSDWTSTVDVNGNMTHVDAVLQTQPTQ